MTSPDVTPPPKRLHILDDEEIEALYGRPCLSGEDRTNVFTLAPSEKNLLTSFTHLPIGFCECHCRPSCGFLPQDGRTFSLSPSDKVIISQHLQAFFAHVGLTTYVKHHAARCLTVYLVFMPGSAPAAHDFFGLTG